MTPVLNSFQCPNVYIDRAMDLLTDGEFRVLMYATRHIFGWQDKIEERAGYISLTMFQHGFSGLKGCGLGRGAIIKAIAALVEYGFLKRIGRPTAKGQKYTFVTDGIQWEKLEQRQVEKSVKSRKQTEQATLVRAGGTLNDAGTSNDTMQGTSNDTMQGIVERTESNPIFKSNNQTQEESKDSLPGGKIAPSKPSENGLEEKTKKPRAPHKNAPWHDALVTAFGFAPSTVTKSADGLFWATAAELAAVNFDVAAIPGLYAYVKERAGREKWKSFSVKVLSKYAPDYLKAHPDQPETPAVIQLDLEAARQGEAEAMRRLEESRKRELERKWNP